jgi:hypothetical protein
MDMRALRLLVASIGLGCFCAAPASAAKSEVFVIGALHALHEREPDFSFDQLSRMIQAIKPDLLLLEVRPDELTERKQTPGRPEYPKVIWPLLERRNYRALPMEPGEPLFGELVGKATAVTQQFESANPDTSARLSAYRKAQAEALLELWESPADVHGLATLNLTAAAADLQHALMGKEEEEVQARWDDYMAQRAIEAVRANPGKRVLVLGSYRNQQMFVTRLKELADTEVVDMATWLRKKGFGD